MNEDASALDDWKTIADAAAEIGVSERTLRRYLKANEHRQETQAGTQAQHRQTNTGTRRATVIAPAFITTLKAHFHEQNNGGTNTGNQDRHNGGANAGTTVAETPAPESVPPLQAKPDDEARPMLDAASEMRLAVVYERLIKSKDDQIESLTARVEALESALQREQDNTARAQALQAMKPQVLSEASQPAPQPAEATPTIPTPDNVPPQSAPTKKPRRAKGLRGWLIRQLLG